MHRLSFALKKVCKRTYIEVVSYFNMCKTMASVERLPVDILFNIIYYATHSARIDGDEWSQALSVLAVCREWRAIGAQMVYKYAFIDAPSGDVYDDQETDRDLICPEFADVSSNIQLAIQNGFGNYVTRLKIEDYSYEDECIPYTYILRLFGVDEPDFAMTSSTGLDDQHNNYTGHITGQIDGEVDDDACRLAAIALRMLPNVTDICLRCSDLPNNIFRFTTQLVSNYLGQLSVLKIENASYYPVAFNSSALKRLTIVNNDKGGQLPQICPTHLEFLELKCVTKPFSWDNFRSSEDTIGLSFDNLRRLKISDHAKNYFADNGVEDQTRDGRRMLRFSKLKTLELCYADILSSDYQHMLQLPINKLIYTGSVAGALKLCLNSIGVLDELKLVLTNFCKDMSNDNTIEAMNDIFKKASNVKVVHCTLHLGKASLNWDIVDSWHLTHLTLTNAKNYKAMFSAVCRMPKLVELNIDLVRSNQQVVGRILRSLKKLRRSNATLSDANIRYVNILHHRVVFLDFTGVSEELVQLLPKLRLVNIKHGVYE